VRPPLGRSSASPVESLSSSPLPGCEATIEWLPIIEGYERTECRAGQTGSKPKKNSKIDFLAPVVGMAKSAFLDPAALVDDNSLTQGSVDPHLKAEVEAGC